MKLLTTEMYNIFGDSFLSWVEKLIFLCFNHKWCYSLCWDPSPPPLLAVVDLGEITLGGHLPSALFFEQNNSFNK